VATERKQICGALFLGINEELSDAYVDHRLDLLRFEAGTVAELVAAFDQALEDTRAILSRAKREAEAGQLSERTQALLRAKQRTLQEELAALLTLADLAVAEGLEIAARAEVAADAAAFDVSTEGVDISWTQPPIVDVLTAVVEPVGSRGWPDRLASNLLTLHDEISAVIAAALARGASMDAVANELGTTLGRLEGQHRSKLVALARTEIQRVANTAALASYEANSDVVSGVQYLATLDSRTCPVCAPLHGTTYALTDADIPTPPLHPRCRCFLAPLTRSWAELGLGPAQASLFDGATPAGTDLDFPAWLKRQPDSVADDILGPTKAEAWRNGVPLSAFSDGREPLTVEQVKARYPAAFS
jgi:SPP1 gp7 family putative phage head morphogenesis protein